MYVPYSLSSGPARDEDGGAAVVGAGGGPHARHHGECVHLRPALMLRFWVERLRFTIHVNRELNSKLFGDEV